MEWLKIAKTLALSRKTRIDCECGTGKTKIINHTQQGYSFFCFRCDDQGFVSKGKQTLEELAEIKRLNETAEQEVFEICLPEDFTTDIPVEGRLWLYKAGVTPSVWKRYNFGFSERLRRVIMPVYDKNNKLIWFQARAILNGQKPKYLNPTGDREALVFWAGVEQDKSSITVVEDILSAIRVGTSTPACSLLGTKITTAQANQLSEYNCVTTWLDADRAGRTGAYKVRRLLGMVTEVRDICTEEDPKGYSNAEIKEILCSPNKNHTQKTPTDGDHNQKNSHIEIN